MPDEVNPEIVPTGSGPHKPLPTAGAAATAGAVAGAAAGAATAIDAGRWKVWREMTAFILVCVILWTGVREFIANSREQARNFEEWRREAAAERREDQARHEANLNRVSETTSRRHESLVAQMMAMTVATNAAAPEMRGARMSIEALTKELKDGKKGGKNGCDEAPMPRIVAGQPKDQG